jgi:hypothetical protein
MKEQLLQEAYNKFRMSLGQHHEPLSPKAMEYLGYAMEKYAGLKWIPVSEKLPEHENNVLAVLDGQVCIMCYLTIRQSGEYFKEWAKIYDALDGDAYLDDEYYPTHWMEVPKPPKNNLDN